jgi:hypothetical protein
LRVEHRDVELFHRQVLHPRCVPLDHVARRLNRGPRLTFLAGKTTSQLQRSVNADRPRQTDPWNHGQRCDGIACNPTERSAESGKEDLSKLKRGPILRSWPEQKRQ